MIIEMRLFTKCKYCNHLNDITNGYKVLPCGNLLKLTNATEDQLFKDKTIETCVNCKNEYRLKKKNCFFETTTISISENR